MNWGFWIGTLNAVLNVLFIGDFISYAATGNSLAAVAFGEAGSLSDLILTIQPGMTPSEFLIANGILLAFSVVLLMVSIWMAYASSGVVMETSSCSCRKVKR